jgi:surfeit locus 1 family protein
MPKRHFRPSWAGLLATLVVMAVCLRLAFWQLERADVKARWLDEQITRSEAAPLPLRRALTLAEPANHPIRVTGTFDNDHSILLDNRVLNRVAGYHVLTPLRSEEGATVLVNRGWVARGRDRNRLPTIPAIEGIATVHGFTYQYSDRTFTLAEDDLSQPQWPLRVQKIEIDALSKVLGVELAPFEIRVDPEATLEAGEQMPRVWHDPIMGPERHRGYALQWFAMALAALIFFLAASFRREPTTTQEH